MWDSKELEEWAYGKRIVDMELKLGVGQYHEDALVFELTDGAESRVLHVMDQGRQCCEHRYMSTDDGPLSEFCGAQFRGLDLRTVDNMDDGGDVHEIEFLEVKTTAGSFVIQTHNEHNGYYGGFSVRVVQVGESKFKPCEAFNPLDDTSLG